MKVIIENIIASGKLDREPDIKGMHKVLEGSRYQPEVMDGIIYEMKDPRADVFLMRSGIVKLHGLTSMEKVGPGMDSLLGKLSDVGYNFSLQEGPDIQEIVASTTVEGGISPKKVMESFSDDEIIYDPNALPGFIMHMGSTGIEVLLFPEGKIIVKGAGNLQDAVATLEMVLSRISV